MGKLFFIFYLTSFSICLAQQIDSTIYFQIKNDKRILGIHYAQVLYKNENVKEEGWEYKKENNRTDGKYWGKQYDKFPVLLYRVGEWKHYYKNGKLKLLDNIPMEDDSLRKEKHYNKKGELKYEFSFTAMDELSYRLTEKGKRRKLKNFSKKEYRNGKLWLVESYANGRKNGVWKEYDKNQEFETTIEYRDGKKIKRIKERAKY